jgi:deoxyribose-phosphate aldolase
MDHDLPEKAEIPGLIDHTFLKPPAMQIDIERLCRESKAHHFHAVCVPPVFVQPAKGYLKGSPVKVCTVVGFPLGYHSPRCKLFEAEEVLGDGADEIDFVVNLCAVKAKHWKVVEDEMDRIVRAVEGRICKAIIEVCYLTEMEKEIVSQLAVERGVHFVKTSTGFGEGGATVEDIRLIRRVTHGRIGVKATGGIRTLAQLRKMLEAGATRIGTSSSVHIMEELLSEQ